MDDLNLTAALFNAGVITYLSLKTGSIRMIMLSVLSIGWVINLSV